MPPVDASLRDAAVLVTCLDETDASGLFDRLGPTRSDRIREAMSVLGTVSRSERERVIRAFLRARRAPETATTLPRVASSAAGARGVELDEGLARRLAESADSGDDDRPTNATQVASRSPTPFAFLLETEADVVAPFLARESPQTVALVLSFLRRRQAAGVLKRLEPSFQADVLKRLARLDDIDPASVDVVAEELHGWITRQHNAPRNPEKRDGLLRDLLANRRTNDRAALIAELSREVRGDRSCRSEPTERAANTAREPAPQERPMERSPTAETDHRTGQEKLGVRASVTPPDKQVPGTPPRICFDDLVHLTNDDLLRTFQLAPRDVLILALVGADERLIQRITHNVPRREAKRIKRSLHLERPTRLDDIESAKRRVAEIATEVVHGAAI